MGVDRVTGEQQLRRTWLPGRDSLVTLLAVVSFWTPALAQTPSSTPVSTAPCRIGVGPMTRLDQPGDASTKYAVDLFDLGEASRSVSGTLSLFSDDHRYDVPFQHAMATRAEKAGLNENGSIVVSFRSAIYLRGVSLSSVNGDDGRPCVPATVYVFRPGTGKPALNTDASNPAKVDLMSGNNVSVVKAGEGTKLRYGCDQPFVDAIITPAMLDTPQVVRERGIQGSVDMAVLVSATGNPDAIRILASAHTELNDVALQSVRQSHYEPAIFACQPAPARYILRVTYTSH